jgi:hypothetical protein
MAGCQTRGLESKAGMQNLWGKRSCVDFHINRIPWLPWLNRTGQILELWREWCVCKLSITVEKYRRQTIQKERSSQSQGSSSHCYLALLLLACGDSGHHGANARWGRPVHLTAAGREAWGQGMRQGANNHFRCTAPMSCLLQGSASYMVHHTCVTPSAEDQGFNCESEWETFHAQIVLKWKGLLHPKGGGGCLNQVAPMSTCVWCMWTVRIKGVGGGEEAEDSLCWAVLHFDPTPVVYFSFCFLLRWTGSYSSTYSFTDSRSEACPLFSSVFFLIDSLWISYHVSHSSPCRSICALHPCKLPSKRKQQQQCKHLTMEAVLCRTALLASVYCNESIFWFETSGFCYTINPGPHWDSSQISCGCLVSWISCCFGFHRTSPFMCSSSS